MWLCSTVQVCKTQNHFKLMLTMVAQILNLKIAGHCHHSYWDTVLSCGHLLQMLQGTLHITPSSTGEAHRARALLDP